MRRVIKIKWTPNVNSGSATFELVDVGCEMIEEWNDLSAPEQEKRLQSAIDSLPHTCFPVLDKYFSIEK